MKPQAWLAPLTPVYAAAIAAKNAAYDRGLLQPKKLRGAVVSVGNLSTGGGGKTPFVIALASLLVESGVAVDILSRGYGRRSHATTRVDVGPEGTVEQFGDEPLLMAREAGVPVYVGAQRYDAGLLAEREAVRLHLLDDALQHRQLGRDLEIVLLHRDDLQSRLLPAGHLREPLSSLGRAQVVVLREEDRDLASEVRQYLQQGTEVWHIRRQLKVSSIDEKSLAVCGIARPQEFFSGLQAIGVPLVDTLTFPDHHPFSAEDLQRIGARAKASGASRVLMTAKDLVRLAPGPLEALRRQVTVEAVALTVTLLEPGKVLSRLESLAKI